MTVAYLIEDGGAVQCDGERLVVRVGKDERGSVPTHGLRQLVIMGNLTLTPRALDLVLERGIDTVLLTRQGRYRGRFTATLSSNLPLRLAQYDRLRATPFAVRFAKQIVVGKIRNQRAFLLQHARAHPERDRLLVASKALSAAKMRAEEATELPELRGCEGSGAATYFGVFAALLHGTPFVFDKRTRRPPLDPVNALLSLGYTLMTNAVEATIVRVGLDPYLGALHEIAAGRPSLACDLVEEYRAPVVDALVVAALKKRALRPEDFLETGPGAPVEIKREALRWFVTLFERKMNRELTYAPTGQKLSWRLIVEAQVRRLARDLLGGVPYECVEPR
jgi:CRISP-associated protein Cas1